MARGRNYTWLGTPSEGQPGMTTLSLYESSFPLLLLLPISYTSMFERRKRGGDDVVEEKYKEDRRTNVKIKEKCSEIINYIYTHKYIL